jgi:hypothetical protein
MFAHPRYAGMVGRAAPLPAGEDSMSTRRSAILASLLALVPAAAAAREDDKKPRRRRGRRRRCPACVERECPVAGELRECETPCETADDCPREAVACLKDRCRYCPSDQWELVIHDLNRFGGKVCRREGFSELRAGCEPW